MKKEELKHYLELSVAESLKGEPSVIILDTDEDRLTDIIFSSLIEEGRRRYPKVCFIRGDEAGGDVHEPYYPFLGIIAEEIRSLDPEHREALFDKAQVYMLHRDIIGCYCRDGRASAAEEVRLGEVAYEQSRFRKDIFELLRALKGPQFVFLFPRIERLPESSLELIRELDQLYRGCPVQFIFSMDRSGVMAYGDSPRYLEQFARDINGAYSVYEVGSSSERLDHPFISGNNSGDSSAPSVARLENLIAFLCLREASDLARKMLEDHDMHCEAVLLAAARSHYLLGELDKGLYYAGMLMDRNLEGGNAASLARGCRLASMMYKGKGDGEYSLQLARQALHHAQSAGDVPEEALAYYAIILAMESSSTSTTSSEDFEGLYESAIRRFTRLGYKGHLASIYSSLIYLMLLFRTREDDSALETCRRAIRICQEGGNDFQLSATYRSLGFIYLARHEKDLSGLAYEKAERIMLGNPLEYAQLYNGIGYYHFYFEDYGQAVKYYYRALAQLEVTRDYEVICETLVNLAFCFFLSRRYDETVHFLEQTLDIINFLNISDLTHHPRYYIYCVLGISYGKSNRISKALEMLSKAGRLPQAKIERPYLYHKFIQAEIERNRGMFDKAAALYEETLTSPYEPESETRKILLFCYREYIAMCREKGDDEGARRVYGRALEFIGDDQTLSSQRDNLERAFRGPEARAIPDLPFHPFDSTTVIRFARLDENLNQLHRKVMNSHFLQTLQDVIIRGTSSGTISEETGKLIRSSFPHSLCLIVSFPEEILFASRSLEKEQTDYVFHELAAGLTRKGKFYDSSGRCPEETPLGTLHSYILLPMESQEEISGFLLITAERKEQALSPEDTGALRIAVNQLASAVQLEKARQSLVEAATVDSLTGVFNRAEFERRMEFERARAIRYADRGRTGFSLFFIDLDNFKYCNDTFGHEAGDRILKAFADILRKATRSIDILGRFGGDEFTVLLPETAADDAKLIARRILQAVSDIVEREQPGASVPPGKELGCSIGIHQFQPDSGMTVDQVIRAADRAMYEAKGAGKNRFYL